MPNTTVRANARTLPKADRWTPQKALEEALLAERAELIAEPLTEERQRAIAACDRLLFKLALRVELEPVR
jgi:hypothetical protein